MWAEDKIPACRYEGHPAHEDRRKYMVAREVGADRVVWFCQRCTEIYKTPILQVVLLPKGRERSSYLAQVEMRAKREALRRGMTNVIGVG